MPKRDDELLDKIDGVRRGDPSLEEKLHRYRRDREAYEQQVSRSRETNLGRQSTPRQRSARWQQSGYTRNSIGGAGTDS